MTWHPGMNAPFLTLLSIVQASMEAKTCGAGAAQPQLNDKLMEPLTICTLPHLTPHSLIALRSTCKALTQMIDAAPATAVAPVLASMLPSKLLQHAQDASPTRRLTSSNVQQLLSRQQSLL